MLKSNKELKYAGARFRREIKELIEHLKQESSQINFVKCIKPNKTKTPFGWEPYLVYNQIKYQSIPESVKIRQDNYPIRIAFKKFCDDFHFVGYLQHEPIDQGLR